MAHRGRGLRAPAEMAAVAMGATPLAHVQTRHPHAHMRVLTRSPLPSTQMQPIAGMHMHPVAPVQALS